MDWGFQLLFPVLFCRFHSCVALGFTLPVFMCFLPNLVAFMCFTASASVLVHLLCFLPSFYSCLCLSYVFSVLSLFPVPFVVSSELLVFCISLQFFRFAPTCFLSLLLPAFNFFHLFYKRSVLVSCIYGLNKVIALFYYIFYLGVLKCPDKLK